MSQLIGLTGATGFIGRRLLLQLKAQGFHTRALVRRPGSLDSGPGLDIVKGDLDHTQALERLVRDCDAVVHLAGAIGGRSYADYARVNAAGTRRLVEVMEQNRSNIRLILISSLAAREPQLSHYAASKRAAEVLVETSDLDWFILRPPAVYGPDDPALAPFWTMLARGWLLRAGPDNARFSLLHVDDLCSAIIRLLREPVLGRQSSCLDDGHRGGYRWAEIAELAARMGGRRVSVVPVPTALLRSMARLNLYSSRLRGSAPILVPGKVRELTHIDWVCDSRLAEVLAHWRPQRALESALHELPGWRK